MGGAKGKARGGGGVGGSPPQTWPEKPSKHSRTKTTWCTVSSVLRSWTRVLLLTCQLVPEGTVLVPPAAQTAALVVVVMVVGRGNGRDVAACGRLMATRGDFQWDQLTPAQTQTSRFSPTFLAETPLALAHAAMNGSPRTG